MGIGQAPKDSDCVSLKLCLTPCNGANNTNRSLCNAVTAI
jgi:hypothetical protein